MAVSRRPVGPGPASGFTMIELMVAIVVAAILLAVAVPSFETTINSGRLSGAANEMMAGLQSARMEAVRTNRHVVLCLSPTPNAAAPVCNAAGATGWIVFRDADKNGNPTADDVVRVGSFHQKVQMKASAAFATKIAFRQDGLAYDGATGNTLLANGAVAFCIPSRRPPENIRYVNISVARISITRGSGNGACPSTVEDNNPP